MRVTEPWLIIPDIHDEIEDLDKILNQFGHIKKVLTLGDWFDSFNHNDATETAVRRKEYLSDPNHEDLMGNHCIQYAYPHINELLCSGYGKWKENQITSIMTRDDWAKVKLHKWFEFEGGKRLLATHAGFHAELVNIPTQAWNNIDNVVKFIDRSLETAQDHLFSGHADGILRAGRSRGGTEKYGGVTWCDFREFELIPGIDQVMGHTYSKFHDVRVKLAPKNKIPSKNVCIDTGLMHVVIVEPDGWNFHAV